MAVAEECLKVGASRVVIGDGSQVPRFEWAHLTLSLKNFIGITPLERYGWMSQGNYDRVFLHRNDTRPEDFGRPRRVTGVTSIR